MTSTRRLACWGFFWLALIAAAPAFGQEFDDVSFCVSPQSLDISALVGAAPTQHVIAQKPDPICTIQQETLTFPVSVTFLNGTGWLSVPPSVTFVRGQANSFTVTVNYAALPGAGVYQALVFFFPTGGGEVTPNRGIIPVTVTLSETRPRLSLSQTTFLFQVVQDGPAPPAQTLRVFNDGTEMLDWSLSGLPSWLTASPQSGTSNASQGSVTTLTADPTGLAPGVLQALVTVSAPGATNDPQLFSVTLLVASAATPASAGISLQGLLFVAEQGGTMPAAQDLTVSNAGGGTLTADFLASTESGGGWLMVSSSSGTTSAGPFTLQVSVDPTALAAGVYRGKVTGTFSFGPQQEVDVLLVVAPPAAALRTLAVGLPGAAQCAPKEQELLATTIGNGLSLPVSFPRVLTAVVVDDCGSTVTNATVVASVEGLNIPLRALGDGFYSGTWVPQSEAAEVTVTFAALHPDFTQVQRSFTVETAAAPGAVSLPTLFADGVVEGAGFTKRRPLTPGGIISLFGARFASGNNFATQLPLERALAGVSVRIGVQDAPLYFVGPGQINAQVPFEVSPGDSVPVAVTVGGLLTAPQDYLIAPVQPGVFIDAASGNAAILDASFQLVTAQNSARPGDTVQIFCTGLGTVEQQVETGAPAPSFSTVQLPVTVTIGGLNAPVDFQGLAPGFVGLYQVNAVVPSGVEPGDAVSLVLTQNGIVANPDQPITIPVQAP